MKGKVLLRCDLGARIGMGHYRRCRALAEASYEEGLDVSWRIGVEAGGSFTDSKERVELTEAGAEDWREFSRVACGFDLVVIDHYELAAEADKRADFPWMRFDAGVGREPTTAALIHNALPGMHQDDYAARLLNPKARVLKGPTYALLDGSFLRARLNDKKKPTAVSRILLTFGGGDDRGATQAVLAELDQCLPDAVRVVVTGSANSSLPKLQALAESDSRIELRVDEAEMARVMPGVDAAVTAGGTTLNELACLGVPAWVVAIAGNQIRPAQLWDKAGAMKFGGEFPGESAFAGLREFLEDQSQLHRMGELGKSLVDGLGAQRTARTIGGLLTGESEESRLI
jgi:spore coat polysaccharide biosynthesis predicted glycosyltransferase SpsG